MMLPLLLPFLLAPMVPLTPVHSGATPAMCPAPNSTGHCIYFTLERPGIPVPRYTVIVLETGKAHYVEGVLAEDGSQAEERLPALVVGPATVKKIFAAEAAIAAGRCETHLKHIANSGRKTLQSYTGVEVSSCVFNFSDDERVNAAATLLEAVAETMQFGQRLDHAHRFDRLGLDAEIDLLVAENKEGRAIEVQNISPVLQSIVDDDHVMERVRRKAARLLQDAVQSPPTNAR